MEKLATPSNGGIQHLIYVNEPNLYRVIFRSNKAEARHFQDWVFNDWINKRIDKYGFVENQDFIRFHKKMEANNAIKLRREGVKEDVINNLLKN